MRVDQRQAPHASCRAIQGEDGRTVVSVMPGGGSSVREVVPNALSGDQTNPTGHPTVHI